MTIKSIIELAAFFVNASQLIESGIFLPTASEEKINAISSANTDLRLLLRCTNVVLREIASCYDSLKFTESITTNDGIISYLNLSKTIKEPLHIVKDGEILIFTAFCDHIVTQPGTLSFTYAYIPPYKAFSDEAEISPHITDRLVASGVAAEYCLINGRYGESALWDKRYKDALSLAPMDRKYRHMPAPTWR